MSWGRMLLATEGRSLEAFSLAGPPALVGPHFYARVIFKEIDQTNTALQVQGQPSSQVVLGLGLPQPSLVLLHLRHLLANHSPFQL